MAAEGKKIGGASVYWTDQNIGDAIRVHYYWAAKTLWCYSHPSIFSKIILISYVSKALKLKGCGFGLYQFETMFRIWLFQHDRFLLLSQIF